MAFDPRYKDLVSLLTDSVAKNASRPLFGTKKEGQWSWITYADFGRMVDQCRAGLASLGVGRGDRVAAISNNRVEWAAAAYATYGLGAAFVPMYEAQQDKEWKFILNDCSAKVAIGATPAICRKLRELQADLPNLTGVVCLDAPESDGSSFAALLRQGAAAPRPAEIPEPSLIAGFIYTSGTTGNPKGVLLSHGNLAMNVSAMLPIFPISAEDRSLSFLPWAHSFGQTAELHMMVANGASMGICEGVDKIIPNLAEVQPTVLMAVPRIFNRIYDGVQKQIAAKPAPIQALFRNAMSGQTKLRKGVALSLGERISIPLAKKLVFTKIVARFGGRLRYAISGGAALSKEVAEFVDNLGITVFEGFGLTETSPIATANTPDHRRIGSVGKAIPGVTVKLDHESSGNPEEGEIVVYGHNVMQGYHNLPEESAKVFTLDGGFRTGDLGRIDKDGFLFITGRIKELYKLENGKYVAPAALEEKVQLSPFILQAMVSGANKPYNVAVIVPDFASLKPWAEAQGIDASKPDVLCNHEKVRALVRGELDKYAAEFKGFEAIRDFVLVPDEWTTANDMLTPKMSMKRRNIVKRYERDIEALYGGARNAATA
jgi:long-chain acyl-CoA synthetase